MEINILIETLAWLILTFSEKKFMLMTWASCNELIVATLIMHSPSDLLIYLENLLMSIIMSLSCQRLWWGEQQTEWIAEVKN